MRIRHDEEESSLEEAVRSDRVSDPTIGESAIVLVFLGLLSLMGLGLFQLLAH